MHPKRHWKTAKRIVDDLMPVVWDTTSRRKLEALPYGESSDFFYKFPDDVSFIYYRFLRVEKWDDHTAALCSRSFNPFIDVFVSDYACEMGIYDFTGWVRTVLYHETIHALQHRYDLFHSETPEKRFEVPYRFWDTSKRSKERHLFLQQTSLAEMDASLGEFWCENGYLPESEEEVFNLIYGTYDYPTNIMRRVARYVWGYFFEGKSEKLSKKRTQMFYNAFEKQCLPDQETHT